MNTSSNITGIIDTYLAENLPDSEKRITAPIADQCQVSVVIPAYGERDYILGPLESLSRQGGVTPDQYEVIAVVNNPGRAPVNRGWQAGEDMDPADKKRIEFYDRAMADNLETLKLLRYINGEDSGEEVHLEAYEKEIIARIKRSGLRIHIIDKASPGQTLPDGEAHVGGARNRGAAEALERYYKQLGRNGIIAQTDADTWLDENYISQVIKAFNDNPEWIALSGRVMEIVYSPEDSARMKEFNNSLMKSYYNRLVQNVFTNRLIAAKVTYYGCNSASRAYELAAVGGVPKIAGHEDHKLGERFSQMGEVGFAPDVIVSAAVRYSARASSGRGHDLIKYRETLKQKGTIEVRSFDSQFLINSLLMSVRNAIAARRIMPEFLKKILRVNNQPIFSDQELFNLSRRIAEMSRAPNRGEGKFREISEEIFAAAEKKLKPVCIKKATAFLIDMYCKVDRIKETFHAFKNEVIEEIKEYNRVLENLLDEIFKDNRSPGDARQLEGRIVPILEKEMTPLVAPFLENRGFIKLLSQLIAASGSKGEALEMLRANYMSRLFLPEPGTLEYTSLELRALYAAVEEIELDRPVFNLVMKRN